MRQKHTIVFIPSFQIKEYKQHGESTTTIKMDLSHLNLRMEMNCLQNRLGSQPMTYLPADFVLNKNDVLCGRGAVCFNHIGTKKFRQLIDSKLDIYVHANRAGKTKIICDLVHYIRCNSPSGGFVKFDLDRGRHYEVGDFQAVRFPYVFSLLLHFE